MPLAAGDKLGPYEIISLIGKGGMGEVYSAHDPRTGRDVAIKVSAERFNERFDREVRAVASLNHPNICTLFDVGPNYLVMELVEGESPQGPLPLETALMYARQIADALEAAHEKGITHRDLKPANIKIKPDGTVKVLDFGLAKVTPASPGDSEHSPTLSMAAATQAGIILGTAGYMSPEQARGKPVDKRADIWAFGVVLYEMITGDRMFAGDTISDTLAQVLMKEPDLARVPVKTRKLLARCLQKEPRQRLRDIGEARFLLEDDPAPMAAGGGRIRLLPWVVAAVAIVAAVALGVVAYRYFTQEPARVLKYAILPPGKNTFAPNDVPVISPDGRRLAFTAASGGQASIWVRDLDSSEARLLPGTEGAELPFWSPDSRFLAFFAEAKLKKIDLAGGPALTLCDSLFDIGGTWSKDDVILFTPALGGLFRVPAAGGTPTPATAVEPGTELLHKTPWFLPDGHHFLYSAVGAGAGFGQETLYVGDLGSKARTQIQVGNSNAVYAPPGYLIFLRGQTLMAQSFDASKARLSGDPVPIAQNISHSGAQPAAFSSSQNGVLAYGSGSGGNVQLTWFNRSGKTEGTVSSPGQIQWPAISPDGATVAFSRTDPKTGSPDIWLHDLVRHADSRFTFGPQYDLFAFWSPDGSRIVYMGTDKDGLNIHQKATSGPGQDEILDSSPRVKRPLDWSRDGKYIIEDTPDSKNATDIWVLPLDGDKKPFPYLNSTFNEAFAKLSPDGHWLAYVSDESKRPEIYVQTFPMHGGKWQVSIDGGSYPIWSRDGKELYFLSLDQKMMAAEVRSVQGKNGVTFERSVPKPLFDVKVAPDGWYDVSKDGKFLIPVPVEQIGSAPVNIVINWPLTLKK